jgi:hypothetical protein
MRKFLHALLMILMLTPGLACGPILGVAKAQAAQASMPGCKGMGMDSQKKAPDGDHVFFKDCMKIDLYSASHVSLKVPDLGGKVFFIAWAIATPDYGFKPAAYHAIRGPPPDWPGISETQPSILLTTQRLRV